MEHLFVTDAIDNTADELNSDDIVARLEELEEVLTEYGELTDELMDELIALRDLAADGDRATEDWNYGVTLIHEDYLTDYIVDFLQEIYEIPDTTEWSPFKYIDWEAAAEDCLSDYTPIELSLGGYSTTYYVR